MPVTDAADGYALALDEARRALDEQERAVAHLSTRAGMLLSAAAVVTSLLGGPVLARGSLDVAAWVAVAAFVAHGVTAVSVLRPRRSFEFAYHPAGLIAEYIEPVTREPLAAGRLHRELALQMCGSIDRNRVELEAMATSFTASGVLLAIEILAWVVSIAIAG
jgi:hypothetical protein